MLIQAPVVIYTFLRIFSCSLSSSLSFSLTHTQQISNLFRSTKPLSILYFMNIHIFGVVNLSFFMYIVYIFGVVNLWMLMSTKIIDVDDTKD